MKYELNLIENYRDGEISREAKGISIGRAEGVSIGEANERTRIVKSMHSDGVPIAKISQYVSIPVGEVETILKK